MVMAATQHLEVLYEDEFCIVINKPAGLAVQGGKGISISLDNMLAQKWSQRPFPVHRLDRDTSGILLVAKTKEAAAHFSRLLAGSKKQYIAICAGRPANADGIISSDLSVHGSVKKCETRYRLLNTFRGEEEFSLLELELCTGRMHQIRRHLAMTGNPILGDDKYGNFDLNHKLRKTMKLKRLLLHASRLVIPETPGGGSLDLSAPLPEHFRRFMDLLAPSTPIPI